MLKGHSLTAALWKLPWRSVPRVTFGGHADLAKDIGPSVPALKTSRGAKLLLLEAGLPDASTSSITF